MKKILIIVITIFMIIIAAIIFYSEGLYNKQINYRIKLLDQQARTVGLFVDSTNNRFTSDFNQIIFSEDLSLFFSDNESRTKIVERMKLFFSKYGDLITGIKLYDNNRNEFTIKKDEKGINWLEQNFVLHMQGEILSRELLSQGERGYEYFLPVIKSGIAVGNMVVNIDFSKYFREIFKAYNCQDYQWQWIVSDSGEIIFDNNAYKTKYSQIERISAGLKRGSSGGIIHKSTVNNISREIISSYYSTQLLKKDFGLVFSSPADNIQKYIIRNSVFLGLGTLLLLLILVYFFWKHLQSLKSEIDRLSSSEKMLIRIIEEMPAGVIIHNKNREIIKANRTAAMQYSFASESEMTGKIFPEPAFADENNCFLKNSGGNFGPDQFIILKKEVGEVILYRTSIPVIYLGEDARMEMLIDVSMFGAEGEQKVNTDSSKTEFLARMNYELRTPLNGIIGMTDILEKQKLPEESKAILGLLRRSAEILLKIINDILDFSKIESGNMILDEIAFNLREEIVYCYDIARTSIDEKLISFKCNVDDNVPDKVIGDPSRLRQILTNFINHSIVNTGIGQINLRCNLIDKKDGELKLGFELSDTGKSFDKASLKKIFGDYINIESKILLDDDESGFGTILARQLIELMDGKFSAESPSGLDGDKGTKIAFSIMLYSNENPEKNLSFDNIITFGQVKTLVITGCQTRDEEILGSLHKLGLSMNVTTYQKSTVSQIKTSLNYPGKRYHLIVILNDRDFNGFEAAREIWENNISQQFVIMIISSDDEKGNLMKCNIMGIDHYIVKPYEIRELFDIVKGSFPWIANGTHPGEKEKVQNDLRILIVEDNKMNQKVIGTMLKSLGYSFDFADNGLEGLIIAKTRRYDVIFMDLIMPEMDGFESARRILEYDNTLLIAAFTADSMPDSRRKAELSGIKEFIPKPVRIDDLKKFFSRYFTRNIKSSVEN